MKQTCLVAGLHCLSKIGECQARTTYNVQCKIRNTFNQRESDTQQRDRQSQPTSLHLALNISIIFPSDFQTQTTVSDYKYHQGGHFKWHGISDPTGVRCSLRYSPYIYPAYNEYFLLCTNVLMVSGIFAILSLSPNRTVNINPDLLGFLVDEYRAMQHKDFYTLSVAWSAPSSSSLLLYLVKSLGTLMCENSPDQNISPSNGSCLFFSL